MVGNEARGRGRAGSATHSTLTGMVRNGLYTCASIG